MIEENRSLCAIPMKEINNPPIISQTPSHMKWLVKCESKINEACDELSFIVEEANRVQSEYYKRLSKIDNKWSCIQVGSIVGSWGLSMTPGIVASAVYKFWIGLLPSVVGGTIVSVWVGLKYISPWTDRALPLELERSTKEHQELESILFKDIEWFRIYSKEPKIKHCFELLKDRNFLKHASLLYASRHDDLYNYAKTGKYFVEQDHKSSEEQNIESNHSSKEMSNEKVEKAVEDTAEKENAFWFPSIVRFMFQKKFIQAVRHNQLVHEVVRDTLLKKKKLPENIIDEILLDYIAEPRALF